MAKIAGGVVVTGPIVPTDDQDKYPVTLEEWSQGSYRTVDTIEDMNKIPDLRRKEGMLVYVLEDKTIYRYEDDTFKVANIGGTVDMSKIYTKEEVDEKLDKIVVPDDKVLELNNYYKKSETYNRDEAYSKEEVDNLLKNFTPTPGGNTGNTNPDDNDYITREELEAYVTTELAAELANYYDDNTVDEKIGEVAQRIDELLTKDLPEVDLTNYYTKATVDNMLKELKEQLQNISPDLSNVYTKEEVDQKFDELILEDKPEVDLNNYYKKSETYNKEEIDNKLQDLPAGEVNLEDYYKKTEVYNKAEVDQKVNENKTRISEVADQVDNLLTKDLPEVDLTNYYKKNEIDDKLKNLPSDNIDLSNYYSKNETYNQSEIDQKIDNVTSSDKVDLSNYYNKQEVDKKIQDIDISPDNVDLSDYYKKSETYSQSEIDNKISNINIPETDLSNYYNKQETEAKIDEKIKDIETGDVDLSDYYTKSEVDDKLKDLPTGEIPDVNLENYYDKTTIDNKLNDKADKSSIPSVDGLLEKTEADSTYLKKTDAESTYLKKEDYKPNEGGGSIDPSELAKLATKDELSTAKSELESKIKEPDGTNIVEKEGKLNLSDAVLEKLNKEVTIPDIPEVNLDGYLKNDSTATISGNWTFTNNITSNATPASDKDLVHKKYVDDAIANANIGGGDGNDVDLSGYAKTTEVETKIESAKTELSSKIDSAVEDLVDNETLEEATKDLVSNNTLDTKLEDYVSKSKDSQVEATVTFSNPPKLTGTPKEADDLINKLFFDSYKVAGIATNPKTQEPCFTEEEFDEILKSPEGPDPKQVYFVAGKPIIIPELMGMNYIAINAKDQSPVFTLEEYEELKANGGIDPTLVYHIKGNPTITPDIVGKNVIWVDEATGSPIMTREEYEKKLLQQELDPSLVYMVELDDEIQVEDVLDKYQEAMPIERNKLNPDKSSWVFTRSEYEEYMNSNEANAIDKLIFIVEDPQ